MTDTDIREQAEPYENVKYPIPDDVAAIIVDLYDKEKQARHQATEAGNEGDERKREQELLAHARYKSLLNAYLHALNKEKGWSLRALANAMGNVWIQTVSNRVTDHIVSIENELDLPDISELPAPKSPRSELVSSGTRTSQRKKSQEKEDETYRVPEDVQRRLRELSGQARKLRGKTSEDDPKFLAAKELAILLNQELNNNATATQLARIIGVTPAAVQARLGRWGMKDPYPSAASTINRTLRPDYKQSQQKIA